MPSLHEHSRSVAQAELDDATERLGRLREECDAFERLWREPARIVVLDTSALMAVREELISTDWFKLIDHRPDLRLRLVVPLVVVDELDNLKDRGNSTARTEARTALRLLEPLVLRGGPTELPDVKHDGHGIAFIEELSDPPTHHRLPSADDEIVRQAAMLSAMTGYETIVATRDTGMLIRVRDSGLTGCRVEPL